MLVICTSDSQKQVESHVWTTDRLTMWRNIKEEKRHLMNSLNNLYLLQLPSRVSSDDFHMDCAAACCSQGQFARGKALAEECCGSSRPASIPPRRSFLHCPVAVGLAASPWLWQEEEDDESGAGRRSPQHWPLCELLGAVKLWELIAKLCFTKLTHVIDSQGQDLYLLSFHGTGRHFVPTVSELQFISVSL